jgi:asparagine synthase (glutamine-hydrolysing)
MCGIAGWYTTRGETYPRDTIERMLERLIHRGPDAGGAYFGHGVVLGHRRLSIIDLAGGAQPFCSKDGRYYLSFNGQIYNYVELREQLKKKGYVFQTSSDTEVLLNLLIEGGVDALNQVNGMFAFAFWDSSEKNLLLARDRFGVKPLYLAKGKNGYSFASELKALLALPDFDTAIDQNAVIDFLSLGYIRAPRTIFCAVSKIKPGNAVVITPNGLSHQRWYKRSALITGSSSYGELTEQIRSLLEDSIRLRQRSDVPLGSLLSGGIDSSAVSALAAGSRSDPLQTFSVGFGKLIDELPFANLVAKAYRTDHNELQVDFDQALSRLPKIVWHMDEPNSDTAALPSYAVSEFASRRVKVVLTGIGGDELFGGYTRYYDGTRLEHIYRRLPKWLRRHILQPTLEVISNDLGWRAKMNDQPELMRHLWHSGVFVGDSLNMLMGTPTSPEIFHVPPGLCHPSDLRNNFMAADIEAYLPDDVLALTDRMSMAVSLEAREPFLDHRLVELCYQIPSHRKLDPVARRTKILLRESVGQLIPSPLLSLKKQGFGSPISGWLADLREPIARLLNRGRLANSGIVDSKGLKSYLLNGASYDGIQRPLRLWTLLSLELWIRVYIDGHGTKPSFSFEDLLAE